MGQVDLPHAEVFSSDADLGNKLRKYIRASSKSGRPFRWTYTDPSRRIIPSKIAETYYYYYVINRQFRVELFCAQRDCARPQEKRFAA
jgi:hypothetical protein